VKGILLDPEAREGDQVNGGNRKGGMLREPILWISSIYRGLGCKRMTHGVWQGNEYVDNIVQQNPVVVPSVFSYYQATDRAPGSNLLAPEQKLLNTVAFTDRLGTLNWRFIDKNNPLYQENMSKTACRIGELGNAFSTSPSGFLDLVSKRWFRGAMPATLRNNLLALSKGDTWETPDQGAFTVLQFALTSPSFGVIK